jgi:hypothetical protein
VGRYGLDSEDRLTLVRVEIERAKIHLNDLEGELIRFKGKSAYVVGGKSGPQTGFNPQLPVNLPELSWNTLAIAGDLVHNLRSSYDHLAGQLVWVGTGKEPSRQVEFPIAKDFATYEADKPRKVKGMRDIAIRHIDNLKPYNGGNQLLWRIHELDNIDKHRMLFTVAHDMLFVADWMPVTTISPSRYWLKTGDPHFAGVFDPEVEKDVQLEIEEAFGKAKVTQSDALLPSLQDLISFPEETIFSFKPLLE